jgi:hypothetical protein
VALQSAALLQVSLALAPAAVEVLGAPGTRRLQSAPAPVVEALGAVAARVPAAPSLRSVAQAVEALGAMVARVPAAPSQQSVARAMEALGATAARVLAALSLQSAAQAMEAQVPATVETIQVPVDHGDKAEKSSAQLPPAPTP